MKSLVFLLMFLGTATGLFAQPEGVVNLIGIPYRYWACDNYQKCDRFEYCSGEWIDQNYFHLDFYTGRGDTTEIFITKAVTNQQLRIKGLAVMTLTDWNEVNPYHPTFYSYDTMQVEETLMIWNGDMESVAEPAATAVWQEKGRELVMVTAPQCLMTMYEGDTTKFLHFGLQEVFFDQPVTVDSLFFIGGTLRNNRLASSGMGIGSDRFFHRPTVYPYVSERYPNACATCVYDYGHYVGKNTAGAQWDRLDGGTMWSGPFFLILEAAQFRLTAVADDSTHGTVYGSGLYDSLERVIVRAAPVAGYRFAGWSDGVADNPRIMEVTSDTTVVASFRQATGMEEVSDPELLVYPNPAQEELFVTMAAEGRWTLRLYDATGRVLLQCPFAGQARLDVSHLSAGQYIVMLLGEGGVHVDAFVKR